MPAKRSARPSASTPKRPAAKRQKRLRPPSAMASGTGTTPSEPEATEVSPVSNSILPPELIDQLVTRVADEVSLRMASTSGVLPSANALAEVPFTDPLATSSSLVQDSITAVQKNLTGETIGPRQPIPDQLFVSSNLPLDARVSDKIRAKIWNEEYIDFGTLIANPEIENKYSVTVNNAESGSMLSLCLEPASKPKKITTIDAWSSCFLIFVGVYTSKYPAEAPALMKYGEIIRDLAARGHNWSYYDQNFRFLRQRQASAFPWGVLHGELWLRAQSPLTRKPQPEPAKPRVRANLPRVPAGFCFKYHRGLACPGCSFKHSCYRCSGDHRATQCNFRLSKKPSSNTTQSAKSKSPNTNKS